VNLSKTKVVVFNALKARLDQTLIPFHDNHIDTSTSYTYLGVLFSGPRFSMREASPPRIS